MQRIDANDQNATKRHDHPLNHSTHRWCLSIWPWLRWASRWCWTPSASFRTRTVLLSCMLSNNHRSHIINEQTHFVSRSCRPPPLRRSVRCVGSVGSGSPSAVPRIRRDRRETDSSPTSMIVPISTITRIREPLVQNTLRLVLTREWEFKWTYSAVVLRIEAKPIFSYQQNETP